MLKLTSTTAAELRTACCAIVNDSIWRLMRRLANPQEPAIVAALNQCTPLYTSRWRSILAKTHPDVSLSTAAVFTHLTPKVTLHVDAAPGAGPLICELADQLVAVIDRRRQTAQRPAVGRAMLIQAKMAKHGEVHIGRSDSTQLKLLAERPKFSVTSPRNGPIDVDLRKRRPDVALFYGLFGPAFPRICCDCCFPYEQWSLRDNLSEFANHNGNSVHIDASATFASVVVGMLQGQYGWHFKLPPHRSDWNHFASKPRDHWSYLISYLLHETFSKSFSKATQASIGAATRSRGNETPLYFTASGGKRMSTNGMVHSLSGRSNDHGSENQIEWERYAPSGDGGDDGPPDIDTASSEYAPGPISAIVFEIGNTNESDR